MVNAVSAPRATPGGAGDERSTGWNGDPERDHRIRRPGEMFAAPNKLACRRRALEDGERADKAAARAATYI